MRAQRSADTRARTREQTLRVIWIAPAVRRYSRQGDDVIGNALLAVALLGVALVGYRLLRRAFGRVQVLAEEVALGLAWIFVGGGLIWLSAYLRGETLLGFAAPWTWLAAAHFGAAGFGALTITALTCRTVSNALSLSVLRALLVVHPLAYLVTAAGISGVPHCNELGATAYELIFVTQLGAFVLGRPDRIAGGPRLVVALSLLVPVVTLVPSLAWAWGAPLFDLSEMIRYHGLVNATGHVGLGFVAFGWGRPEAHSSFRPLARRLVDP
jgi:hypothetical protein